MAVTFCGGCTVEQMNGGAPCRTPQVEHEGMVLGTGEINEGGDSDFIAAVWDVERGVVRDVGYGSTRFWTYHNGASVDAGPDVVAAALAWYRREWTEAAIRAAHDRARTLRTGVRVRSLTVRGHAAGAVGTVEWLGPDRYARSRYAPLRAGIRVPGRDRLVFASADRVEVLDPDPADEDEIRAAGARLPEPAWGAVCRSLAVPSPGCW